LFKIWLSSIIQVSTLTFFYTKKGYIPLFKVLACISPGITRVIHLIKNLFRIDFIYIIKSIITVLMSHTQFNHRSWIRNSTQLLLTLAWLNLSFESRSLSPTRLSRSMASLSREVRLMAGLVTLLLRCRRVPTHCWADVFKFYHDRDTSTTARDRSVAVHPEGQSAIVPS
jgi:hypothetical protein